MSIIWSSILAWQLVNKKTWFATTLCFEQLNASYLNKSIHFIQQFIHFFFFKEQQQHTEHPENVPNNLYICPFLYSSKCMCIAQVSLSYHSTSHKIHNNGVWMVESVCPFLTSTFALLATTSARGGDPMSAHPISDTS